MTADHVRPLLESARDTHLLFSVAELLAKGRVPIQVGHILRMGRMTALRKDGGGVRGIVAGEVIRRFTAKTIAQQLESVVNVATSPFQYALSTRAGCECIAHALQALTELDPDSTIMSIDGISAYDTMSRKAMLEGLEKVPGGSAVLPFVLYLVSKPERVGVLHDLAQRELWAHCRIRIHGGKTHVWNQAGQKPEACDRLQRVAVQVDPTARVWPGSELPTVEQGIKVLGTPIGHHDYVLQMLSMIQDKHRVLLDVIPIVPDVQSAWLLLLHCAAARANYYIRVVRPDLVDNFAQSHDQTIMDVPEDGDR